MMNASEVKFRFCEELDAIPIPFFDNYLITKSGKIYYIDLVNNEGTLTDISNVIYQYNGKIPVYRLVNKDKSSIELPLDKLLLLSYIGDMNLTINYKDYDKKNITLANLKYNIVFTKISDDSIIIADKLFKQIPDIYDLFISNDGIVFSKINNNFLKRKIDINLYHVIKVDSIVYHVNNLVYHTWNSAIHHSKNIIHIDSNTLNNFYSNLKLNGKFNAEIMFSSDTDLWATPQKFFDELNAEFHFTLDPCATPFNTKCDKYYTLKENGLLQDWSGEIVFCNPPYGSVIKDWVEKCYNESKKPNTTVVMLIPARTDTIYFHRFIYNIAKEIRFLKGRLKFGDAKNSAPFPSMVVIF